MSATSTTTPGSTAAGWRFDYLPVSLFGSVMGLTGRSIAWRLAQARYGVPGCAATGIGIVAITAFILLTLGYAVKFATAPAAVRAEFRLRSSAICLAQSRSACFGCRSF